MALPKAEITLIGMPFVEELVVRSPHIDRFSPFSGFLGMAEQFFDPRKTAQFFSQQQKRYWQELKANSQHLLTNKAQFDKLDQPKLELLTGE